MTSGLTSTGFVKRTLEDILAQYEADEIAEISPSLDASSSSPVGQINGVIGKSASEVWDELEAVYTAGDPDKNEGDGQDAICAITGTTRNPATNSYVAETLGLNAGVTVPAGSVVSVLGNPSVRFTLIGPEPAPGGKVVPGPVTSIGAGSYTGRFQCDSTGPIAANAGTLTVIVTPVTGWNSATNATDAVLGANVETHSALRQRREAELDAVGSSPVDALRAKLLKLTGMQQATVFENVLDVTDGNGVPPHSIECLCYDGPAPAIANDVIAQRIWESKAGGIRTYGGLTGNALDAQGNTRVMSFSRPTQKPVYFTIDITIDSALFPGTGDADIKTALVAKGLTSPVGGNVVLASFYSSIFGITGVKDVAVFRAGFAPAPVGTANLALGVRELATFDTSRIIINHV